MGLWVSNGLVTDDVMWPWKVKTAATTMLEKFQVAISPQPVVQSTSCFVLGWGFRGRRI